jgi:hypothetical protein
MTAHDIFDPDGRFRHRKDKVNGVSLHSGRRCEAGGAVLAWLAADLVGVAPRWP